MVGQGLAGLEQGWEWVHWGGPASCRGAGTRQGLLPDPCLGSVVTQGLLQDVWDSSRDQGQGGCGAAPLHREVCSCHHRLQAASRAMAFLQRGFTPCWLLCHGLLALWEDAGQFSML